MEALNTNAETIEDKIKSIISFIGDNPEREGLKETPDRIIRSWKEIFRGYNQNPEEVIKTFVEGSCDEMVILKDIDFFSMCEHHFLPFYGKIHIGYIPNGKVIGVSKLARLVEVYSRRLQIQERMTTQIADIIEKYLNPQGVMVVCKAQHFCIVSRGIKKVNTQMITSAIRGVFKEKNNNARQEFMEML